MVFSAKLLKPNKISKNGYLLSDFELKNSEKTVTRKFLLIILIFSVSSFIVLYHMKCVVQSLLLMPDDVLINVAPMCSDVPNLEKLDCYPDAPVTETDCVNRGCCYSVPKSVSVNASFPPLNVPYCYYPSNYKGYEVINVKQHSSETNVILRRTQPSGFPKDVATVKILIKLIDNYMLRIKITDNDAPRFEVPIGLQYQTENITDPLYDIELDSESGYLAILRKSTKTKLFSTNLSRLVFSDQFLQLTSSLPSPYFYGIGEHYSSLLRNVNWTRFTLINSDLPPVPNHGLYGSHPFYMALESDGNASGVFLFNSNIMDIVLQPTPAVTFRPIGGIFDFFIMLGPSPNDVTRQYSSIVGKTFMPPLWSLGFHLCRFGYGTLNKTREVMQRNINAGIPLDVQWNDIDYMENYKDFTYDKKKFAGLPEFVDDLHASGRHYVIMTDPGLSNSEAVYAPYDEGVDDDLFIKNLNGSIFVGKVWTSGTTVFPDFTHPAAISFWTRQFKRFYNDVKFDGVWIDMNEPSNFYNGEAYGCPDSPLESPQYVPGGNPLKTKTVCMSAKHYYTSHYNEHNLYAYREAVATYEALKNVRKKRPFIISRATFPGQGVYSGHWSGDIASTWEDMRYTIPSMINFNMYAIPMVGSDICGFNGNTTVELCARWQALGAFYPFSRNHNERVTIEQDPVALGATVIQATRNSLMKRYILLPYLYTLFYKSHVFGDTVIRPLFFEFPEDMNTYDKDEQFLWGSSIMIIPCLYPNTTKVSAYFPKGLWYDESGTQKKSVGEKVVIKIPITNIPVSFRGGYIIPFTDFTTPSTPLIPFNLAVILDEQQNAFGELYWDDGNSLETFENGNFNLIKFEFSSGVLKSSVINDGYQMNMNLSFINIMGLKIVPKQVKMNGMDCTPKAVNVSKDSTQNENVKPSIFKNLHNEEELNDKKCTFFADKKMFNIASASVSLLEPLLVTLN